MTLIRVPDGFAADTLTREGEAARTWLGRLPELVGELCVRWGLRVTGDPMHGYMALVVPVLRGDARCALKVSWIDDETVNEAAALALWNGGGAVRLLDADDTAGALLLEWLDPRRSLAEARRFRREEGLEHAFRDWHPAPCRCPQPLRARSLALQALRIPSAPSRVPDGLGMGLAICRSIIEAHGGRLWVSPRAPHGADVRFTIPFWAEQ